jgi:hypothetical protein
MLQRMQRKDVATRAALVLAGALVTLALFGGTRRAANAVETPTPAPPTVSAHSRAEALVLVTTSEQWARRGDLRLAAEYAQQALAKDPNLPTAVAILATAQASTTPSTPTAAAP